MLIAHGPFAVIASRLILGKRYTKQNQVILDLVAFFAGIAVDFDIFLLLSLGKTWSLHHEVGTHTPIFFLIIFGFLMLLTYFFKNVLEKRTVYQLRTVCLVILVATLSHLFADMITGHISLLYPFFDHGFTLTANLLPDSPYNKIFHPLTVTEIIIFISFLNVILFSYLDIGKKIKSYIITLTTILLTLLFGFSIYVFATSFSYDPWTYKTNGFPNLDTDGDTLIDNYDMDINNDGFDNIREYRKDKSRVINQIKVVLSSNKVTSNKGINKYLGGIDSVRLLDISFAKARLNIGPVLYDYVLKNKEKTKDMETREIMYNYLLESKYYSIYKNTTDFKTGDIVFFDDDNIGIVLDNSSIGIVLPNDTLLTTHTIKEVLDTYKGLDTTLFR